ncbi:MAG: penicillin acylase family protein [Gemmatimonadetes bacterium]|nr:penicillin acylase family protein [Gemmatimonadota bacterium]
MSCPRHPVRYRALAVLVTALAVGCTESDVETAVGDFEALAAERLPAIDATIEVPGLGAPVEILRDPWGVPHIYAEDIDDLFFAQGFVQAQDRLWQMDLYRRAGEGRLAEILGPDALPHDRFARLVKYRGPWTDEEYGAYHPEGRRILEAFTRGVNAYIDHATRSGELPVEYEITGLDPEPWTPEASLLRMQTAMPLADARRELRLALQVAELGADEANRRADPSPYRALRPPAGVDLALIDEAALDALAVFRNSMPRPGLVEPFAGWLDAWASANEGARENSPGSNNWVIAPRLSATGAVFMANDPHRTVANPSLRYVVHLDAPGWTAIGSTEPVLPGVAIGHNGRVAWGLTIVGTDQTDVYVESVDPEDPQRVRWQEGWEPMRVVVDTIRVKGAEPEVVALEYTRHGPVFHRDRIQGLAYALRSTMHEPGTAGYLPALRLNVVDDCREFLAALDYWTAPTENMMCGDAAGNIAWRAAALSPVRVGWSGRLPVPGDGSYEWDGFRTDLPEEFNPDRGWIATANHDIHPPGYDPPLYFKSGTSFPRFERLADVLGAGDAFTMEDMMALQQDAYSAAADATLPLFRGWTSDDPEIEQARAELAAWDAVYRRDSRAAAVYQGVARALPEGIREVGLDPAERRSPLETALREGLAQVAERLGEDRSEWRWGRIQRSEFPHRLVAAWDLPAAERSGGAGTVAATGATYRHIVDFADLDASVFTNAPGQSGRPGSPYYGDLVEPWGRGDYFPMLFTRGAVEAAAQHRMTLAPGDR